MHGFFFINVHLRLFGGVSVARLLVLCELYFELFCFLITLLSNLIERAVFECPFGIPLFLELAFMIKNKTQRNKL